MLTTVITVVHVLVAIGIVGLVLIQHGKGADAGAAFGAGAAGAVSGSVFGAKGSGNFLSRSTAVLATMFFLTSLSLAYMAKTNHEKPTSLMDKVPASETTTPAEKSTGDGDIPAVNKENTSAAETKTDTAATEGAGDMPAAAADAAAAVDKPASATDKPATAVDKPAAGGKAENATGDMPAPAKP